MNEKIKIIIILILIITAGIYILNLTIKDYKIYREALKICKDEGYDTAVTYKRNIQKQELKEVTCMKHTTEKKIINMRDNEWTN